MARKRMSVDPRLAVARATVRAAYTRLEAAAVYGDDAAFAKALGAVTWARDAVLKPAAAACAMPLKSADKPKVARKPRAAKVEAPAAAA